MYVQESMGWTKTPPDCQFRRRREREKAIPYRHKLSLLERIDLDNNQIQGKYVRIEREIDNNFQFLFELKVESG